MPTIFNVRRPDGKIANQSITRTHAEREVNWWRASGWAGDFRIEEIERAGEYVGGARRSGGRWSDAKVKEFRRRYSRGEQVDSLAEYFGTNISVICKRARELGFVKRIDDPRYFEKRHGRWTEREERLINFMYDEGNSTSRIAENIGRGKSAVEERLRNTAAALSGRSHLGRFIAKPGIGNRKKTISPILAEASSADGDSD
jgi:hypothetical protein